MTNSGKFNTTTKVKVSTPNGSVLKVNIYNTDEEPSVDYRIRPKCSKCDGDVGCVCYNNNNSDYPLEDATKGLLERWCCENTHCICISLKEYNPEIYEKYEAIYGDDEQSIVEALVDEMPEQDEESIFCEV